MWNGPASLTNTMTSALSRDEILTSRRDDDLLGDREITRRQARYLDKRVGALSRSALPSSSLSSYCIGRILRELEGNVLRGSSPLFWRGALTVYMYVYVYTHTYIVLEGSSPLYSEAPLKYTNTTIQRIVHRIRRLLSKYNDTTYCTSCIRRLLSNTTTTDTLPRYLQVP
jgi:hypothetical protein